MTEPTAEPGTTDTMIDATTDMTIDAAPHVPWWNIESPLRRRIKGRYVRRAILVACVANMGLVAVAPRPGVAPATAAADGPDLGLRTTLAPAGPEPSREAMVRLAALRT